MAAIDHPENELHLYINSKPVYKRKLDTYEFEIFDSAAYRVKEIIRWSGRIY